MASTNLMGMCSYRRFRVRARAAPFERRARMPILEILVALGVVMALASDTITVVAWLTERIRSLKRWWKEHKRE